MILVHTLNEDISREQVEKRGEQQSQSPRGEDDSEETDHVASPPQENTPDKTPASSSRRPLTRSQTGYMPKRRRRDDSPLGATHKAIPQKKRKPPPEDLCAATSQEQDTSAPSSQRSVSEISTVHSDNMIPPPRFTQLSFPSDTSSSTTSSTTELPLDRRGPRSRVVLPVPVPNLTKKSRGRRVPTKIGMITGTTSDTDPKGARLYVCKVESCRKCFHRGEHLKRHIRSIHTHEKPFACLYADCDKRFNRHDNLLQHLKVHKDLLPPSSTSTPAPASPEDVQRPLQTRPSPTPTPPPEERYHPAREAYEISINQARRAAAFRRQPSYDYDPVPYGSMSEPPRLVTNMAVSSLRTEIPHSPVQSS